MIFNTNHNELPLGIYSNKKLDQWNFLDHNKILITLGENQSISPDNAFLKENSFKFHISRTKTCLIHIQILAEVTQAKSTIQAE